MKLRQPELKEFFTPSLAMTGRVESWIDNPVRRYPVSCTVMVVEDTMYFTFSYDLHGIQNMCLVQYHVDDGCI